jgi:hypothetical protein
MSTNVNCDGAGPHKAGQVRVLSTGGDGNLILCRYCFNREIAFRRDRNRELPVENRWDVEITWDSLPLYNNE